MGDPVTDDRVSQDPERPVYVISVAAELVRVHPRTLRIYELEGLVCPARTRTNIRLYSENDIRRVLWIRHLTQQPGRQPRRGTRPVRARGAPRHAHPRDRSTRTATAHAAAARTSGAEHRSHEAQHAKAAK